MTEAPVIEVPAPDSKVIELSGLPPALPAFVRAGLSASRRVRGTPVLPQWQTRVRALRADSGRLAAYNELCGYPESDELPMLFPQAMATPLFLSLMTRPGFPLPLLGLVHVRNLVEQSRPLKTGETFDMSMRLGEGREVKAGYEFDLITECSPTEAQPV